MTVVATQVGAVAQRSVRRTLRQPAAIVFPLVFPVLLLLVNTGGLKASTALPGFPTDSFLAFALAVPFMQGALFATMNAGTDLARDIQTGFLNRLALTPIRGSTLLAGTLAGLRPASGLEDRARRSRQLTRSRGCTDPGLWSDWRRVGAICLD